MYDDFFLSVRTSGIRSNAASVLMHGPPGCGKTQLAKAVAGEAQAAFISVGPSDILSKFVGESEASIRNLFDKGECDQCQEMVKATKQSLSSLVLSSPRTSPKNTEQVCCAVFR